eukprot:15217804-Alexandrium_andersonii.AAC.1
MGHMHTQRWAHRDPRDAQAMPELVRASSQALRPASSLSSGTPAEPRRIECRRCQWLVPRV